MLERFDQVVDEHKNDVYSFAYYYLGNRQEAEDITQEVFLRLWRSWRKVEIESIPGWLNRVTRNACFDELRRRRSRREKETDEDSSAHQETVSGGVEDPHAAAETGELQRRLRRALCQLPEPYRTVLVLREIRELKYGEISRLLEIPLNTTKTYVFRGRRLLRERLREEVKSSETQNRSSVC